jgi:predicted glycoside hydrolase/deacetylase ChbG (UPF0249 family)
MVRNTHKRHLVVNADDFGQAEGINAGIIAAHEHGIVTSASLMVRWPAATSAAEYARQHPHLSVGLHVDLGEWAFRNGEWLRIYEVLASDDLHAISREIRRQLEVFRSLCGADPTHFDSHQHVHREEPIRTIVRDLGRELQVPVRHFSSQIRYCGDFYGQDEKGVPYREVISVENLVKILSTLPEGTTELACHPGFVGSDDLNSQYLVEREIEVETLCDSRVRQTLKNAGVVSCSFREVR